VEDTKPNTQSVASLGADIVAAYVANNTIPAHDVPTLFTNVVSSIQSFISGAGVSATASASKQEPAVPIKKSITPEAIICLEDGRRFKSLKRHLATKFNMSPDEYRAKWGLDRSYPMVAPAYAAQRSALAKQMGLGQGGRQAAQPVRAAVKGGRKAPATA
jgi:predicted transcriptional regulator